jgi:hypothetical protein
MKKFGSSRRRLEESQRIADCATQHMLAMRQRARGISNPSAYLHMDYPPQLRDLLDLRRPQTAADSARAAQLAARRQRPAEDLSLGISAELSKTLRARIDSLYPVMQENLIMLYYALSPDHRREQTAHVISVIGRVLGQHISDIDKQTNKSAYTASAHHIIASTTTHLSQFLEIDFSPDSSLYLEALRLIAIAEYQMSGVGADLMRQMQYPDHIRELVLMMAPVQATSTNSARYESPWPHPHTLAIRKRRYGTREQYMLGRSQWRTNYKEWFSAP